MAKDEPMADRPPHRPPNQRLIVRHVIVVILVVSVPAANEDKSDQWLGVSVSSQGTQEGQAVVISQLTKIIEY